jgi:hypothetical protein
VSSHNYIYTRVCVCPIQFHNIYKCLDGNYIYKLVCVYFLFYKSAALIFEGIRMVAKPQAKPVVRRGSGYFISFISI